MFYLLSLCISVALLDLAKGAAIDATKSSRLNDGMHMDQTARFAILENVLRNVSTLDGVEAGEPDCTPDMGYPPLMSCLEAAHLLPRDDREVTFGQRRSLGFVDHVVPYVVVSCYNREVTTNNKLAKAVDLIISRCVQAQFIGGSVSGLGDGGQLAVSVTLNIDMRRIRCVDTPNAPPSYRGCVAALDHMPFSQQDQRFGPTGPGVDVGLPRFLRERKLPKAGCVITIDAPPRSRSIVSWLVLWNVASTINAKCVRHGREGYFQLIRKFEAPKLGEGGSGTY
ncbi:MAG: hypothetical protein Q9224_003329 [Gallowayella concinna]